MTDVNLEFYLDVDGVILDFEGAIIDFVRDHYLPDLPKDFSLKTWEMTEEFKELDIGEVWDRFIKSDRFKRLSLLIDHQSFNALANRFPIHLVTNIPNDYYQSREENLKLHTLEYTGLHLAGHFDFGEKGYPTKSATIEKLHKPGSKLIFLDDHPKNCQDVKDHFPESSVYLMSRPHNAGIQDETWIRVENWQEFVSAVLN